MYKPTVLAVPVVILIIQTFVDAADKNSCSRAVKHLITAVVTFFYL